MKTPEQPLTEVLGFNHISILTNNLEVSLQFYCGLLGLKEVSRFPVGERTYAMVSTGDNSTLELQGPIEVIKAESIKGHTLVHFALSVGDVRGTIERLRAAGVVITSEPKDSTVLPGTGAFILGPNGESIEFWQDA